MEKHFLCLFQGTKENLRESLVQAHVDFLETLLGQKTSVDGTLLFDSKEERIVMRSFLKQDPLIQSYLHTSLAIPQFLMACPQNNGLKDF